MAGGVRVERFRWWHVEQVVPLETELFGPWAWSAVTYWSELAAPGRWYRVAVDSAGVVCGWVGLAHGKPDADVQTIAVAPRAQGTGLGRVLMGALIGEAERGGASRVLLEVRADNVAAQKLYARCGFSQIAVRRRYYQPGDVDALILRVGVRDAVAALAQSAPQRDASGAVEGPGQVTGMNVLGGTG